MRVFDPAVLMFALTLLLSQCGCLSLHSSHPVRISVKDAESDVPLSTATVDIGYQTIRIAPVWNFPKSQSAATNAEGLASLNVAEVKGQMLSVEASGYQPFKHYGGIWIGNNLDVRLYRLPPPQITVVVPDGYRGPLKLDFRPSSRWVQGHAGQRSFTFNATNNGYVEIEASPLLLRLHDAVATGDIGIKATFSSGQEIRRQYPSREPDAVALRHVHSFENRSLRVIGTETETRDVARMANETTSDGLRFDPPRFHATFDKPVPSRTTPLDPS
jgi:hypothetical protein